MRRYLKSILLTSLLSFSLRVSAIPADTLKKAKYSSIEFNYGLPIYNKITLNDSYTVNSKFKSSFDFRVGITRKNNNIMFGLSLIQSEFTGKEYNLGAGVIPYKGTKYPYYYNLYQRVKYNVFYMNIGYGFDIHLHKRNILTPYIQISVPLVYTFKIDNLYGRNQSSDTTLFSPSRNSWNNDTNFGRLPRLGLGLSYKYFIIDRLALVFKIHTLYALTFDTKGPDTINYDSAFNQSNNYSYLAYEVSKQVIIMPSIGINFKLTGK